MTCRPEELIAGRTLELLLGGPFRCRDGPGADESTVDLGVETSDGTLSVEVTQAMSQSARHLSAQLKRHAFAYEGTATWLADVGDGADLDQLDAQLPTLLLQLEAVADGRATSAELGELGITRAYRFPRGNGDGAIWVRPAARSGIDAPGATSAVQQEVDKSDNQRKLEAAGGGDLFVWVDVNQPALFFGASGLSPHLEMLVLPPAIRRVWMAIMLPRIADPVRHEQAALNVQSFTAESGWINHGDPILRSDGADEFPAPGSAEHD